MVGLKIGADKIVLVYREWNKDGKLKTDSIEQQSDRWRQFLTKASMMKAHQKRLEPIKEMTRDFLTNGWVQMIQKSTRIQRFKGSDKTQEACLDHLYCQSSKKVERVEIKDVRLPLQLQRAMAAEAEAAREARAKVIAAEGEQKASGALKVAAEVIQQSPHALQLRYLQTLTGISTEQSSTIIFPMPISVSSFNP